MNPKKLYVLFILLTGFLLASFRGEATVSEKEKIFGEGRELSTQTLANPLLLSQTPRDPTEIPGTSLLAHPFKFGYQGDLSYRQIEDQVFRLRYEDLEEDSAFFFLFDEPLNLRNRWVRLRYFGEKIPSRLELQVESDLPRSDGRYDLYLAGSDHLESVYFKLPDKTPFGELDSIRLVIHPEEQRDPDADFMILGLELLPAGEGPLGNVSLTDRHRFENYAEPFEAQNQVSINTQSAF